MPPLAGLRVVHSGIHGYGVVAARAFQPGELVSFGDGVAYPGDEDFDDTYWSTFRDFDARARDELAGGDRHVLEARMKQSERSPGHPRHEAGPALAD